MALYDDGAGEALYVGGQFGMAGGAPAGSIAKWDGSSWSTLASGVSGVSGPVEVTALEVHDEGGGSGPALYAGGQFNDAGGQPANHIAKWDGSTWSPLGSGADLRVYTEFAHNEHIDVHSTCGETVQETAEFGVTYVDFPAGASAEELDAVMVKAKAQAEAQGGEVPLIYLESPANPTNALVDIEAVKAARDKHFDPDRCPIAIDSIGPLTAIASRSSSDTRAVISPHFPCLVITLSSA